VILTALLLSAAAAVRLPPVEQCSNDPGFTRVRQQLERVVHARDLDGLLSLMSKDVRVTFGGRYGRDGFREHWTSAPDDRARLWRELDRALRLGCAEAKDGKGVAYRAIPAMFVTGDDLDGISTWVALPGALLRARPTIKAEVKMRLPPWTVLDEVEHDGGSWIEARTPKGRRGYVRTSVARSLLDYRIIFGRRDGAWRITAFVAGD
jgi:hypothetical protein